MRTSGRSSERRVPRRHTRTHARAATATPSSLSPLFTCLLTQRRNTQNTHTPTPLQ